MVIKRIQQFFTDRLRAGAEANRHERDHALKLATAALLIEVAHADAQVLPSEQRAVTEALQRLFGVSCEETEELVAMAEAAVKRSVSLFQFTHLVDQHFSPEEKARVIEMMWRVAFADQVKDKYEEHLVRQVAELLHVPHGVFTQARYRVEQESTALAHNTARS
jgi:uncharacterized tellurite resistance protein B-like protein